MAGVLPPLVALVRNGGARLPRRVRRTPPHVVLSALRLLAACAVDPLCAEEIGWVGGHAATLRIFDDADSGGNDDGNGNGSNEEEEEEEKEGAAVPQSAAEEEAKKDTNTRRLVTKAAESLLVTCTSGAPLVSFPTLPKPGFLVDDEERQSRLPLTFTFGRPGAMEEKGEGASGGGRGGDVGLCAASSASSSSPSSSPSSSTFEIVLQEIPTTHADIFGADRANLCVGYHMWDAGTALGVWVVKHALDFAGKVLLELGSGLGLPGIVAAAAAPTLKSVTLTDFHDKILANLRHNIAINTWRVGTMMACGAEPIASETLVRACHLDWDLLEVGGDADEDKGGDTSVGGGGGSGGGRSGGGGGDGDGDGGECGGGGEDGGEECGAVVGDGERQRDVTLPPRGTVDIVLGSDIVCQDSDCLGIVRALRYFLNPNGGRAVFICGGTKNRYGIDKLPAACAAGGLDIVVEPVGADILDGIARNRTHNSRPHDDLFLISIKLKE
jgi:predicted nicotinamide N-methyase